jgi:hypothetical protein
MTQKSRVGQEEFAVMTQKSRVMTQRVERRYRLDGRRGVVA